MDPSRPSSNRSAHQFNMNHRRHLRSSRQNKSDLIDFSQDLEHDSPSGNILELFDPLTAPDTNETSTPATTSSKLQDPATTTSSATTPATATLAQPPSSRRVDRRFRTTSASIPRSSEISIIVKPPPPTLTSSRLAHPKQNQDDSNIVLEIPRTRSAAVSMLASIHRNTASTLATSERLGNELNKLVGLRSAKSTNDVSLLAAREPSPIARHENNNCDLTEAFESQALRDDARRGTKLELSRKHQRSTRELVLLTNKLKLFRAQFKHQDRATNPGIVYSPILYSSRVRDMSVKVVVTSPLAQEPLQFTCSASTTVEHIISHAVCSMLDDTKETMESYMLKVTGKDEFFDSKLCLADYAIVSHCWKFDLDVQLTLLMADQISRPYLRTSQDDYQCESLLSSDDLLSRTAVVKYSDLNYEALNIIIETFDREADRLYRDVTNKSTSIQTQSLLQATKAICSLMLNCETAQLTESKNNLAELCRSYKMDGIHLNDEDRYKMIEVIQHAIKRLVSNMHRLLKLTSESLLVDYEVADISVPHGKASRSFVETPIDLLKDQVSLRVQLISQLKPDWLNKYFEYHLEVSMWHGERMLCPSVMTDAVCVDTSFFPRLTFDQEITFQLCYSGLPREARFEMTLIGTEFAPAGSANQLNIPEPELTGLQRSGSSSSIASTAPMYSSSPTSSSAKGIPVNLEQPNQSPLAASMTYIFDQDLKLRQGDRLLRMHPLIDGKNDKVYIETIADRYDPVLVIEFKLFPPEKKIYLPQLEYLLGNHNLENETEQQFEFEQLDSATQQALRSIIDEKSIYEHLTEKQKTLLWDHRLYLTSIPAALPRVLLAVPKWSVSSLRHTYQLIGRWAPLEAIDALQLLMPSFPDVHVRNLAVSWISHQHDDELYDCLPQLIQAMKFEREIDCAIFWLLLERSLKNVRIANAIYWQLKIASHERVTQERCETLMWCLRWTCGRAFFKSIDKQEELLARLSSSSSDVKKVRDNQRMSTLRSKLELIQDFLSTTKPTMPWAPSLEVCDIDINSCSYFPSNTLPLKLAFRSCERSCNKIIKFHTYDAIFKAGDDLRQDMLAIQLIRIMEKLWLREGLDLCMVTFDCIATNDRQGLIEMVPNAETLRKIHQNTGFIAGSFNQKAIDNYIRLWNTSELEYRAALGKFLYSCAGYSVATYILGICDRHNDNIMITHSGHLFHIDFGKFLGDAQMMGSIKRDRTPFVLTADMAYVINGGDKPTKKFQNFIELCTLAFNIVRRHRNLFLNLFSLMSHAQIHGLDSDSVKYIDKMLMPNLTESEAMAKFAVVIDDCLNSRSAQMNFFIHNLAQLRFSNDNSKRSPLSFVPKTFTMQTDGEIESLEIINFYKKYEPEKQYYYVVRVKRKGQPDTTSVSRTFREFCELHMQLVKDYHRLRLININRSTSSALMDFVGRTNTREIAEKRRPELATFLRQLLELPEQVRTCDLIYTFFHPILRDQQTASFDASGGETSGTYGAPEYSPEQRSALYVDSKGQVKVSLVYKNMSLIIMVMHAKNLNPIEGQTAPNCYAKTYLLPDPHKQTKRKTRIVRQSCHPSFMELITYKSSLDQLKRRTLKVAIWHSDLLPTKYFLGSALLSLDEIDLTKETTSWYPLKNY